MLELLAGGAGRGEVLEAVTLALEELIPGSRCSVLVLDAAGGTLHHGAAPSLPAAYSAAIDGMPIGEDAGSCGAAAYLERAVVAEDIAHDVRWERFRALALPHGLGSCWSSPIHGHDGVLGTFAVYHAARTVPTTASAGSSRGSPTSPRWPSSTTGSTPHGPPGARPSWRPGSPRTRAAPSRSCCRP